VFTLHELLQKLDATSWNSWKKSLGMAVEFAEELGVKQETITNYAAQFGGYLTNHVPAELSENMALKELWEIADSEEQKAIASCMVKLAKNSK